MLHRILQLPIAAADSLEIDIEKNAEKLFEKVTTTPIDQLLQDMLHDAIVFGLKVVAALLIYIAGAWLIKRVKKMLVRIFSKRNTDKAISSFVESLVSITLTVLLIIITVGTLGVNTTSLAALLAAGGMAIGMALSGTVQNFAGGIMLLVFKPFKAGDFIETQDGYSGTVTDVNIVSTKLTTTDNRIIIIPNGSLSNGTICNYTMNTMRRVEWLVGVEYGTVAADVKAALQSIIDSEPRVLYTSAGAPADPLIAVNALKDSAVEYLVRAWVKKEDYWDTFYCLNEKIYKELPEKGIGFPFPQMDVHLKQN